MPFWKTHCRGGENAREDLSTILTNSFMQTLRNVRVIFHINDLFHWDRRAKNSEDIMPLLLFDLFDRSSTE